MSQQQEEETPPHDGRVGPLGGRGTRRIRRANGHGRQAAATEPQAPEPQVAFVKSAILRVGRADFADIAAAHRYASGKGDADDEQRHQLRDALPGMVAAFERKHGAIVRSQLTDGAAAACLTDHDELIVALGQRAASGPEELIDLLRRCEYIAYTA